MMQEDRLYHQFKANLEHYAPEVPATVYQGMRRKLWLAQFWSFNMTSLNVWYVGIALVSGLGIWTLTNNQGSSLAQSAKECQIVLVENGISTGAVVSDRKECNMKGDLTCSAQSALGCDQARKENIMKCGEPVVTCVLSDEFPTEKGMMDQNPGPVSEVVEKPVLLVEQETAKESIKPTNPKKRYTVDSYRK